MLIKISEWAHCLPKIKKEIDGADVSELGSFAHGECPEFTVEAPRKLGASAVVLRIRRDGEEDRDYPLAFTDTDGVNDIYKLTLDTRELCGEDTDGLFFYELIFLRGFDTLFTSTDNNVDYTLKDYSDHRFLMLVYQKDMQAPAWFSGRVMYQIFVDRFCKGEGSVGERDDVIINEDWENGIPQYVERPGEDLKNNMFFGGNLWGVIEKLDYLKSVGVGMIYLNPVFEAYSNHKYDTGDYLKIDKMFGGEEGFDALIKKADELNIKIILDGVFNHTGDNSRYFDRHGEYGGVGAYKNRSSEYRSWYSFRPECEGSVEERLLTLSSSFENEGEVLNTSAPEDESYECWWGIKIMPRLNHQNEKCRRFFTGEDGVGARYIRRGIGGWRLDVADELCDEFLDEFSASVKRESNGDGIVIGEVWENAAEKIAYGKRRRYLRGGQLDSVMNYPLRNGILDFVLNKDSKMLGNVLKSLYSCYPKPVCDCLMNILGTHDTERVLTVLGKGTRDVCWDTGSEVATRRLDEKDYAKAVRKLMLASAVQYTVYGVPSLYYGDEAGLEGYRDPFCRMPYPWGRENAKLLAHYRTLGKLREENRELFAHGYFKLLSDEGGVVAYTRTLGKSEICVIANATGRRAEYALGGEWTDMLNGGSYDGSVGAVGFVILKKCGGKR